MFFWVVVQVVLVPILAAVPDAVSDAACREYCYENIDCLPQCYPWVSPTRPVPPPQDPKDVCTTAIVYTKTQRNVTVQIYPTVSTQVDDMYDPSLPTYIINHGFTDNGYLEWIAHMANAILERGPANVFIIDWEKGSQKDTKNYPQAVSNVRTAAAVAVNLVKRLQSLKGNLNDFHVIGHSLGAHLASYICKSFHGQIGKLTGLDAAGPGYHLEPELVRFAKNDAKFTDAIHTNAGQYGMFEPIAVVDFFANLAIEQPQCLVAPAPTSFQNPLEYLQATGQFYVSCSHQSVHDYYNYAIENPYSCIGRRFTADEVARGAVNEVTRDAFKKQVNKGRDSCTETACVPLGLETQRYKYKGLLYLETTVEKPYCTG